MRHTANKFWDDIVSRDKSRFPSILRTKRNVRENLILSSFHAYQSEYQSNCNEDIRRATWKEPKEGRCVEFEHSAEYFNVGDTICGPYTSR